MKKFIVILFGIFILGLSFYGLSTNSYYVQLLVNVSTPFIYARIALVLVLLVYVFAPIVRLNMTRNLLGASGVLMLSTGLTSTVSPSLLGRTDSNVLIGDSLILIEAGILAIVLSAELYSYRSQFMSRKLNYAQSLFTSSLKGVRYAQTAKSAIYAPTLIQPVLNDSLSSLILKHLIKGYAASNKAPP